MFGSLAGSHPVGAWCAETAFCGRGSQGQHHGSEDLWHYFGLVPLGHCRDGRLPCLATLCLWVGRWVSGPWEESASWAECPLPVLPPHTRKPLGGMGKGGLGLGGKGWLFLGSLLGSLPLIILPAPLELTAGPQFHTGMNTPP